MTLESLSARTLSLDPNCVSLSASLTMRGRPVSRTLRTMLSLIAPTDSVMDSRRTLRDARISGLPVDCGGRPSALSGDGSGAASGDVAAVPAVAGPWLGRGLEY